MPTKTCPSCSNHDFMNCANDKFGAKLAALIQETLEEIKNHKVDDASPEIKDRKETFSLELANHLLWIAATIYIEKDSPASEAIYELACAFEVCNEEVDNDEVTEETTRKPSSEIN